ncbi:MAG: Oxidoreductase, aldo/keto reductase family [uncultured Thermomicrobiales bacterium]|uniref:Oxidoreductase, aldo/keto reductase family n=1 Tax=uncultured Thermomicrobiales bacterium TaxID=1645740 RepID=A0A6J4UCJ4_9BACT|nr:MAG: Oxidoreductase, aldo/keto reductase family [uncultured Thermomicrobiales bacterium]
MTERNGDIPTRELGATGERVSLLGVGGAHIGAAKLSAGEGIRIIQAAIDGGATFLDNAWEYHDGESERRMGAALSEGGYRQRAFLMTKDCAHDRRADHSMEKLEDSLRRLKTDHLDLWQIHEVVWEDDPDKIFAPGGSAESLLKAKEQGKVRFIGFTGHKHPDIHRRMLSHGFPFDTVQMPLNVLDAHHASFEREILPICQEQGIAVLGMKSQAGGHLLRESGTGITAAEALRYAMSLPVATVISGMDSMEILEQNLATARALVPLSAEERADLLSRSAAASEGGRFEPFKSTRNYEGGEGRRAHNYPEKAAD